MTATRWSNLVSWVVVPTAFAVCSKSLYLLLNGRGITFFPAEWFWLVAIGAAVLLGLLTLVQAKRPRQWLAIAAYLLLMPVLLLGIQGRTSCISYDCI